MDSESLPATQETPSLVLYDKAIFFNWKKGVQNPFHVVEKADYGPTELRDV